jgi:hypothetical protein
MLKKLLPFLFIVIFMFFNTCKSHTEADWTMLVYVQANNSLSSFAHKNFGDMAQVGSGKNLNILVEWHQPNKQGTWRYKVNKGNMVLDQHLEKITSGNKAEDLADSMRWAVTKFPAKKYCLVLWNHGIGILDPSWGNSMHIISPNTIYGNPKADTSFMLPGMSFAQNNNIHRGILFNERTKTYMTNQELSKGLEIITKDILGNKKIDIIGMDACLMSMIEIAYQLRNYTDYFVGSQEVELAYGWDYCSVLKNISSGAHSPEHIAKSIVEAYGNFYCNKIQFYTQSALKLSMIIELKEAFEEFSKSLLECINTEIEKPIFSALKQARSRCLQFSAPAYVDLYSFLNEFQNTFSFDTKSKYRKYRSHASQFEKIKKTIQKIFSTSQQLIIANTTGQYLTNAKGISIYFPQYSIDSSYQNTDFGKDTSWSYIIAKLLLEK